MPYDWDYYRNRFVMGTISLRELSELQDSPRYETIRRHSSREDWAGQREAYRHKVATRTHEAISAIESEVIARHVKTAKGLQAIGSRILNEKQGLLSPNEARLLIKDGADIEREALGLNEPHARIKREAELQLTTWFYDINPDYPLQPLPRSRRRYASAWQATSNQAAPSTKATNYLEYCAKQGHQANAVVNAIAELVERSKTEEVRAVISTPPRHGKTESYLLAFSYLLQHRPELTHAYVTYADQLAKSKSRKARRYATDAGVALSGDSRNLNEWRTTDDGGLLATGVGGPLTGQGITGLGLVDDPIKNRQEAESRLIRDRIYDWFTDVFYTRLERGSSAIIVATRWHPDDLSGRLIKEGWDYVNLPAITNGEALWPAEYPLSKLEDIRKQVGEYTWASLYQGEPRTKGGVVFGEPTFYDELPKDNYRHVQAMDAAYTARTHADYSVFGAGVMHDGVLYVVDVTSLQVELPSFIASIRMSESYKPSLPVHWRGSGMEKRGIMPTFRHHGIKVAFQNATTDKFSNAQAVAAAWNAGNVRLPRAAPWLERFLDIVLNFTGVQDAHDDEVDMLASLWPRSTAAVVQKRTF